MLGRIPPRWVGGEDPAQIGGRLRVVTDQDSVAGSVPLVLGSWNRTIRAAAADFCTSVEAERPSAVRTRTAF